MKKTIIILSCILVICTGIVGYVIYTQNTRCSDSKLAELREKYPTASSSSAFMSTAPNIPLQAAVENAENYLEISFVGPADNASVSLGTDKFGDSEGSFSLVGWRVKVENVVFGDSSLKGKEIVVRMNQAFESSAVSKSTCMYAGVSKREEGDYWFTYAGAFYNVDGYVLSVLEELPGENYNGMTTHQFKKELKLLKDNPQPIAEN